MVDQHSYHMIAMQTLKHVIREAAYQFVRNGDSKPKMLEVSRSAYAFLQGTGLDIMLEAYDMAYDPSEIRNSFHELFVTNSRY